MTFSGDEPARRIFRTSCGPCVGRVWIKSSIRQYSADRIIPAHANSKRVCADSPVSLDGQRLVSTGPPSNRPASVPI